MPDLARALLQAWERGLAASAVERGLLLLSVAMPGNDLEVLSGLSLGERDARLLALRERAFGPRVTGRVCCPRCASELEVEFETAAARCHSPVDADTLELVQDGCAVRLRVLDSTDLAALSPALGLEANARTLLSRCSLSARCQDDEVEPESLPASVVAGLSALLSRADPQSDVEIAALCPDCGHAWHSPFDVASFLWTEVEAWAGRTLREVHALASAYGWREADILDLTPTRRQAYLGFLRP